ncbi:conserved hypothetical protein [Candidatus Methylobacter favarea]|uniref:DUF2383 domain-containing protein n=1 Tax=Candidatus Methylobacter favarea TaxID=2707345 RepID=A0A8S0WCE8_9GAMM|nr:DUF2383 domain-containing protein [Candidatus Methylobacter favarea]CAA9892465.1 conserved hypothetical protein [Candidatus Methylobacter favarea]
MHIETLNKLLKDELSSVETYQQVLEKIQEDATLGDAAYITPIYEEHKEAAASLQGQIRNLGGTPSEDSGAWGTWAEIVQGGANMLGKGAALKALQEGEKSGAEDYEEALQESDLPEEARSLIQTKLLPAQQSHIRTLERLLDVAAA